MEINVLSILLLFGITILLGYVGFTIFKKTKIPDIIWLMIFGIFVASFGLIDRALFLTASPLLAAIALLIILFDAGLNMDFYQMLNEFSRSLLLAILGFLFSMIAVTLVAHVFFGFDLLNAMLLGAIIGGTCSTTVISIVSVIKIKENVKTLMLLESIITDPICIVVTLALIGMIISTGSFSAAQNIASAFSIGAMVGLISGIIWLRLLDKVRGRPFDHMLTLAIVFLLYAGVEVLGGSGAIAALLFGLVLGNGKTFSKMLAMKKEYDVDPLLRTFQSEMSFFIRSFFFVYLGLIVVVNPQYLIYGIVIAAALLIIRFFAVQISTIGMNFTKNEKRLMTSIAPRGLAAAVLAQLPISYGIPGAEMYSSIIFVVIFATVIYTSIAIRFLYRDGYENPKPEEKQLEIPAEPKSITEESHVKHRKTSHKKHARHKSR